MLGKRRNGVEKKESETLQNTQVGLHDQVQTRGHTRDPLPRFRLCGGPLMLSCLFLHLVCGGRTTHPEWPSHHRFDCGAPYKSWASRSLHTDSSKPVSLCIFLASRLVPISLVMRTCDGWRGAAAFPLPCWCHIFSFSFRAPSLASLFYSI
jgi:hypothetical protein